MRRAIIFAISFLWCCFMSLSAIDFGADQSLFNLKIASGRLVQDLFSFIDKNQEKIIGEWIYVTEIPAPSGQEAKRAEYVKKQFEACALDEVSVDSSGNVLGVWKGKAQGKHIVISAHLDTVFQSVSEIKVRREDPWLKAPGIGDDTSSLINLLWSIRALKSVGFKPSSTYYFLATVGEETGFIGMRAFLNEIQEKIDMIIALDDDLGKVHYGALGFGGGRIVFRGPGAHTMQSKGVPNPNLAVAMAVERICEIEVPSSPPEKWTVLNVGMMGGGKVRNAVSQESFLTIDLRSGDQGELKRAQELIKKTAEEVAEATRTEVKIELNETSMACQIPGAKDSFLVKTVVDILNFLKVKDIEVDPLGSTEANAGIERGILSLNLGRTYGNYKHSLNEEANIDGLFLAQKQILLLISCLK